METIRTRQSSFDTVIGIAFGAKLVSDLELPNRGLDQKIGKWNSNSMQAMASAPSSSWSIHDTEDSLRQRAVSGTVIIITTRD